MVGEVAELPTALLPVHLLKQHLFQLWKAGLSLQYHEKVSDLGRTRHKPDRTSQRGRDNL